MKLYVKPKNSNVVRLLITKQGEPSASVIVADTSPEKAAGELRSHFRNLPKTDPFKGGRGTTVMAREVIYDENGKITNGRSFSFSFHGYTVVEIKNEILKYLKENES